MARDRRNLLHPLGLIWIEGNTSSPLYLDMSRLKQFLLSFSRYEGGDLQVIRLIGPRRGEILLNAGTSPWLP